MATRPNRGTKRLLTANEVAEILGAARQTIYQWALQGKLPAVRSGDFVRFDPDDVQAWIDEHRTSAASSR